MGNPINPENFDEKYSEDLLEIEGLLVSCLPCHPQNSKCFYRTCNDIPQKYLDTLFCPLINENEDDDFKDHDDYYMPLAPNVEIDIKKENSEVNIEKKSKTGRKEKVKKVHICDVCGKSFKTSKDYKVHVSGVH